MSKTCDRLGPHLKTLAIIRLIDFSLAALALTLLSPGFLIIAVILRFSGEGEVLYRQSRIGRGGRDFELLKFATMRKDSPSLSPGELTIPGDPRVLPVGRVLRKSKLNELPQLWNVCIGDMSLIGPRPQTRRFYDRYEPGDRAVIDQIRPGLSGVGSILFRDEEDLLGKISNPIEFDLNIITPYKGQIERWAARNLSVVFYWQLLLLSIAVVLNPQTKYRNWLLLRVPAPPVELVDML